MIDLGAVRPGSTIRIPFSSFDKDDGSSITMTNFAVGDILLYKDGSTTERASTSGFTATTDFDSKTGKHVIVIDLADNTTSGFYCAGSEYLVAVDAVTIDGVTTGGWVARFRIGYPNAILDTTIATLASQTSFTLTSGPAEDNALAGHWAIIHDIASAVQLSRVLISAYTGSTKTVTLAAGATFTAAAGDNISIMDMAPLQATTLGRTLDVSAGGEAGIDWANVGTPSSTVNLSGTTVKTLTDAPSDSAGVGTLLTRLSALRAGYLDNLSGGAVATNSDMSTLLSRLSSARAGYLDNLNVAGVVATQADINALNQSASRRLIITSVQQFERPETGDSDSTFTIEARTYDGDGAAVNADSTPTLTATGSATGSLAANLSASSSPATGVYRWTYTVASTHNTEQVRLDLSATISSSTFTLSHYAQVTDLVAEHFTTFDRAKIEAIYNRLPTKSFLTGTNNSDGDVQLDEATGTPVDSAGVTTLLARIGSFTGSGVNTILGFLKAIMSKSATTPSDVGGTFSATTDSLENIKDTGGGDATLAKQEEILTAIGDLSAGTGSGAYTLTITVNDGTTVLQGATVRLVEGVTSLVGTTNASGVVAFSVDAATYAVAITKDGYSFSPTTKVVSGTGSQTYSMTQVASSGSSDPDKAEVTITCYGTDTEPEAGVTLTIQQTSAPSGDENHAFDGTAWTETSDVDGLVTLTLWRNAGYRIKRGAARRWTEFTPNASTYDVSSFAGADE